jgi:hypothetical protein
VLTPSGGRLSASGQLDLRGHERGWYQSSAARVSKVERALPTLHITRNELAHLGERLRFVR